MVLLIELDISSVSKWKIGQSLTYLTATRVKHLNIDELTQRGISMNHKLLIAGVIATSVLLGGCASNKADVKKSIGSLTSDVSRLTAQVQTLESENDVIASALQSVQNTALQAQAEAQRANSRIDNIAASYSK